MWLAKSPLLVLILCFLYCFTSQARKPSVLLSNSKNDRQTQQAQLCLAGTPASEVCAVNPALAFKRGLQASTLEDRLYKTFMAQHVLCPRITSRERCLTDPILQCAWNSRKQRCEADKYATYLLPMSCPGSVAQAYLHCMRKPNEEACKADPACYPEQKSACLPRLMLAQAKTAAVPAHTVAEQVALGILTGKTSVIGSCPEAQLMKRMADLCPYQNPWSSCNTKFCAFDVPPYLPRRPPGQRANSSVSNIQQKSQGPAVPPPPARDTSSSGLTYYGVNPGPICAINSDKLPALLHEVLSVSKELADAYTDAAKTCKETDEVWLDVKTGASGCGSSTFEYDTDAVQEAAGMDLMAPAETHFAAPVMNALNTAKKIGININNVYSPGQ